MKYILMMNTMKATCGVFPGLVEEAIFRDQHRFYDGSQIKELKESGEFVLLAEGLSFPDEAKLIVAGEDGTPVTDGVFPESKEFLAGFWILDIKSPERVYELAARISAAPGKDGAPLRMPIEVRPVMSAPPKEFL